MAIAEPGRPRPSRRVFYHRTSVMRDTAARPGRCERHYRRQKGAVCVKLIRNASLVREQIYPFGLLFVGFVFVVGCIGILGYGLLVLIGY